MKRLLFFLMAIIFAIQGWTQPTLNEGFEGTTFPPNDWRIENTLGPTTPWTRSTSYAHIGSANAYANYNGSGSINYLITPKLTVTSTNNQISFWAKMSTFSTTYNQTFLKVLVSTTTNDVTSFTSLPLLDISPSYSGTNQITDTYQQWTVDLSSYIGQNIYVAFRQNDNDGYGLCLDDVIGPELFIPACPKPTALSATNPTTTGATLSWTDASGTLWNIQYMLATETDWANATTISGVTNPYTINGLNPAISYKVRVQSNCGTELSEWSSPITYTTPCEAITTFPWNEGFESELTCWTQEYISGTINWATATSRSQIPAAQEGTNFAYFAAESSDGYTTKLISQILDISNLSNPTLLFWYIQPTWGGDQNTLKVYYRTSLISPWVELIYLNQNTTAWTMATLSLPNGSSTYQIAFEAEDNYGYNNGLDNVTIFNLTCPIPTALQASNPTTTGVTLGWNEATGNSWNIQYMLNTETDWANATTISGVTTNPYTINGLNPATTYKIRVQAVCGTNPGEWSANISFTSTCEAISTFPWTEGFETAWIPAV
ncbi:MAG: choice-of-anchor J domain-containing protein, partial [Bacteroidales bacterium]